jgi:hypothetical protein
MPKGERGKEVTESYMPDTEFEEYLDAYLHHETLYQEKIRKMRAGEEGAEPPTEEEEIARDRLQRRKSHWLNKCIFPSMANLTVFLEYVAKSAELQKVFDDDLKELFLGRKTDEEEYEDEGSGYKKERLVYGPRVFQRFIQSAITWSLNKKRGENEKEKEKRTNNFRLALIHIIEYALFQHFNHIGAYLLDSSARHVVSQDQTRVLAWAELLARNVDTKDVDDADRVWRPVHF